MIEIAKLLARMGFHVFPLRPNDKRPLIDEWQKRATNELETVQAWWDKTPDANVGICTTRYTNGADHALVVVDVDKKDGKDGDRALLALELSGCDLPDTLTFHTPTGGRHQLYLSPEPVNQRGAGFLGDGLDIRSRGGYIVAPGSVIEAGKYKAPGLSKAKPEDTSSLIAQAPEWLVTKLGIGNTDGPKERDQKPPSEVDPVEAIKRGVRYLLHEAPTAYAGNRNEVGFRVAAKLKDLGLDKDTALGLLVDTWVETKCEPPLDYDELEHVTRSAYNYGNQKPGSAAPEVQFDPVATPSDALSGDFDNRHPILRLNDEYAFVVAGGGHHVLWETSDDRGHHRIEHLGEATFHKMHQSRTVSMDGEKLKPLTQAWMGSPDRRSFTGGFVFRPEQSVPENYYNLWRGFTVDPLPDGHKASDRAKNALAAWKEHLLQNVCGYDKGLAKWLLGYFAHMVQRPWEKPLVALVFKGRKGTGKNALVERVGELLGPHFMLTSNRRYIVGNFNGHMERLLCLTLDEAFWSGDKQAEGILKDLITGNRQTIEHKGKEPYKVENLLRLVIIGNEDWLIPATEDERRYAVFELAEHRMQDRPFFREMREGMEANDREGYRLLLTFLKSIDISEFDHSQAPNTQALYDQKLASMEPLPQWWYACLLNGMIAGRTLPGWPERMMCDEMRDAFKRYCDQHNIRSRMPTDNAFGRFMSKHKAKRRRIRVAEDLEYAYVVPSLEDCRANWANHMGIEIEWEEDTDDGI